MNKYTIKEKKQTITEKFRKRFGKTGKEKLTMNDIKNKLIDRIRKKTGKTKEEILTEINSFIE